MAMAMSALVYWGYDDREPDSNELVKMEQELRDAMDSGAFGMSSGLVLSPGMLREDR